MEPARGESFPSGQRRGPAAPREDSFPFPGQKSFHISTTPISRGQNRRFLGSKPPRTVRKPQPHGLVADWLGLMEPAAPRVASPAKTEVVPLTGRLRSHPRIRNPSIYLQFQQIGNQDGVLWIWWVIPLTMWTEAVSISVSRYCDTLSRQQRSRRYLLCSRDDDVML